MDNTTFNQNKNNGKSVVYKKYNKLKIVVLSLSTAFAVFAVFWGIMYTIHVNEDMYIYKNNTFYVQNTSELEEYVKNENVTGNKVNGVSMTKDGINELIDAYRKPMYDIIGEDGTKKFKEIGYLKVNDVKDDRNTLTVQLSINDEFRLARAELNDPLLDIYGSEYFSENDFDKLIMNMAYTFKDKRNLIIKVKEGHFEKNVYNEDRYVNTLSYRVLFKKSDLSRIKDWKTYSVDKLKELNRL